MLYIKNFICKKCHTAFLISVFVIMCGGNGYAQTAINENITKVPATQPPLAKPIPLPMPPPSSSTLFASMKRTAPVTAAPQANTAVRALYHLYEECTHAEMGFVPCLKKKAILFIDRISHFETINLTEGVKVVRTPMVQTLTKPQPVIDDLTLASSLSRSLDDRNTILTHLLLERLYHFLEQHTLQVSLPKFSNPIIGRSVEEGRGKMKKMVHMMMMGMAMKMLSMLPLAMGFLYILAGKAFIVAKIALLLSAIMIIKKLMQSKGGGSSSSWPSGNSGSWSSSGGGGGYERRSFAQDLAYRSYSQKSQKSQKSHNLQQQKQSQQTAPQQLLPLNVKNH